LRTRHGVRAAITLASLLGLAVLCWAADGAADTPGPAVTGDLPTLDRALTLADCMRIAAELRPRLDAARADAAASEAAVRGQESRRWPTLGAAWDWRTNQTLARPITLAGGILSSQSQRRTTQEASLALDLTFYQTGTREGIRQARASAEAARERVEDTKRVLFEDVAVLYYTALANEAMAQVTVSAVVSARRHLALVDARIELGTAAAAERLPIEVELAQAQLRALQAENALRQSLADLRAAMGLPAGPPLRLLGSLDSPPVEADLEVLWQRAVEERQDLGASRASVRSREWAVRMAKIDAGLSLSMLGHAEYGRYTGVTGESWWLGVGASLPVFSGQARADVDAAQAGLASVRASLADAELQVRAEVEQAYLALQDAAERTVQAGKSQDSATLSLQAAEGRYAEEAGAIIEVTDAEQSLREAQADYVQARYDHNIARVRLRSAAGENLLEALGASQ